MLHTLVQFGIVAAIGVDQDADLENLLVIIVQVIQQFLGIFDLVGQLISHTHVGGQVHAHSIDHAIALFFLHISQLLLNLLNGFALLDGIYMNGNRIIKIQVTEQ